MHESMCVVVKITELWIIGIGMKGLSQIKLLCNDINKPLGSNAKGCSCVIKNGMKRQKDISEIDQKIISMYANRMF